MTEIKIRKKRPVWPWVVLVLAIIAIAYYLWANDVAGTDDDMPGIGTDEQIDRGTGYIYGKAAIDVTSFNWG
jgi:hypothetical protein